MRAALRYRRAQALAVAVLAALVTMCLVLAPLYTRALEQAMVHDAPRSGPKPAARRAKIGATPAIGLRSASRTIAFRLEARSSR